MPSVYKYHCEPATADDASALCKYLHLAADYRRELARIENRARALIRRRPDDELRAKLFEQQGIASRAARSLVVANGLHWGTYQHADEAHSDSCRSTKIFDDVRTFVPGDVGCVAVHLQPARTLDAAEDWIRIGGVVRHGSEIDKSGRVRPTRHREVKLRIGSGEDGPLRVTMHVLMHRELPKDGVVSWAKVKRFRVGSKFRWELLVTVTSSARESMSRDSSSRRAHSVGVDIGWRQLEGRVRIAYWWGTDGRSGEVTISNYVLSGDDKADSIRARRDDEKNVMRGKIHAWISSLADRSLWIVEETRFLPAWLKTWRFVRLVARWRDERIPGDEEIYEAAVAWLKHDRHLWDWEGAARLRRKRQVDEQIRLLAVQLGRQYARIGVEAPITAKLVKKVARCEACQDLPKRCDACRDAERLRKLAATRVPHAAPARTREEIRTFAAKYGAVMIELNPAYTTMDCATVISTDPAGGLVRCGHRRDDVTDWSPLMVGCSSCGVVEDQDRTAACNLAMLASRTVLDDNGKPVDVDGSKAAKRKLGARRTRKATKVDTSQPTPMLASGAVPDENGKPLEPVESQTSKRKPSVQQTRKAARVDRSQLTP